MEKVDVYSNKREKTGKITERDNIEHGEYRLSVHVWFESKEKILIQKRTQNKKIFKHQRKKVSYLTLTSPLNFLLKY